MRARREEAPAAVALRYREEAREAPRVVARGKGEVAHSILELARRHGIPIQADADLLELLALCELGDEIPLDLYGAIAELIAYLYRLNGELAK